MLAELEKQHRVQGTSAGWEKKGSPFWLNACRRAASNGTFVKLSEEGLRTPFEMAFSNLAHSYLAENCPLLMPYEVGFNLIEKDPDNTKAVGVFGFKVGDQWLYAPAFYLNGDLKGHELLYIKSQDLFVPMDDAWINYLLGRKPAMLGKSVERNLSHLGVLPPNLSQLNRSPYKTASAAPRLAEWCLDFLPTLGYLTQTDFSKEAYVSPLPQAMRDAGDYALAYMDKVAEFYPSVYNAFKKFHPGLLDELVATKEAAEKEKKRNPILRKLEASDKPPRHRMDTGNIYGDAALDHAQNYTRTGNKKSILYKSGLAKSALPARTPGSAKVILRRDIFNANMPDVLLSDDDRKRLADEGKVVKDDRPESAVSEVYNATTSFNLSNPTETNVYEILVKPDKFERCLVIIGPHGEKGVRGFCTVISLEGDKRWLNIHPSRVFCRSEFSRETWNKWFDKLDDAGKLPVGRDRYSRNGRVVILSREGSGTCPVSAYEGYADNDADDQRGGALYGVSFSDHCYGDEKQPYSLKHYHGYEDEYHKGSIEEIRFTGRPGKFLVTGDELRVPAGAKMLVVEPARNEDDDGPMATPGDCSSKKRPLQPGNLEDLFLALRNGLSPLDLLTDGTDEYKLNGGLLTKESAFKHLVEDWHFRENIAEHLLKEAADKPNRVQKFLVKLAGPLLSEGGGPNSPSFPNTPQTSDIFFGSRATAEPPFEQNVPVPDLQSSQSDVSKYRPIQPDSDTMFTANQAAQTGQKELFDTSVLGGLLRSGSHENTIDRGMPDLLKGMNRKGRIYFQYLWHGDEFEERYGKNDLPELEDELRNAFKSDGKLILKLKEKAVEPFAEFGTDIDFGGHD